MKKIDEGTFSLEGSNNTYFIRLFEDVSNKAYLCKVYSSQSIFKKKISEKYFFTIIPDFESMVHSCLVDLELLETMKNKSLGKLTAYKL